MGIRLRNDVDYDVGQDKNPPSRSGEFILIKVTSLIFNEALLVDRALITMGALKWFGADCGTAVVRVCVPKADAMILLL